MDWGEIAIFILLVAAGMVIGFPLGRGFVRLDPSGFPSPDPAPVARARRRLEEKDILNAEVIE